MARSYCSVNDLKKYLPPNVVVEGDNPTPNYRNPAPETAANIDLEYYINQASSEIDANLAVHYDIPLTSKFRWRGKLSSSYSSYLCNHGS
jgi:hypothetical protein